MSLPKPNSQAPDFSLLDESGNLRSLSDCKGCWVLLYFYPKDDTPGCTKEACGLRDVFSDFEKISAIVFGISADTVESHKKFKERYNLPFSLLADPEKTVIKTYGVWQKKKFMGRQYEGIARTSFLIDPQGKIVKIYENVNPQNHAKEVLSDLVSLQR
ncbi:MAG: thioredoxin-dependent thiol peroxidase [Patescibacteria group bacterium]|nr:thioredoxin-dependent thiol peroxidase [Patescibacteria group bacterium]